MDQSYKILAAQRLAIDPNALLNYFEFHDHVLVTTPDGRQHKFSFAELNRPAKRPDPMITPEAIPVAKTAQTGPGSASAADHQVKAATNKVVKPKGRGKGGIT